MCEDFVFWWRVSEAATPLISDTPGEPQQSSQVQSHASSARGGTREFVISWGDRADKTWDVGSGSDSNSDSGRAGPIMHAELGKYFSRVVAVDADGFRIPIETQPCSDGGPRCAAADGWKQPHTFAYEPNALLRQFYPVAVTRESHGKKNLDLRYTTDDTISTEKRKERGLSAD